MSRNQGLEKGIVPLTIMPSDPLGKFLLLVPMTLNSAGLEILVSERGEFLPRATSNIPLIWKLRCPQGLFELLMPLNQQVKKRVTVSGGFLIQTNKMKLDCFSTTESYLESKRSFRASLGVTTVLGVTTICG